MDCSVLKGASTSSDPLSHLPQHVRELGEIPFKLETNEPVIIIMRWFPGSGNGYFYTDPFFTRADM